VDFNENLKLPQNAAPNSAVIITVQINQVLDCTRG